MESHSSRGPTGNDPKWALLTAGGEAHTGGEAHADQESIKIRPSRSQLQFSKGETFPDTDRCLAQGCLMRTHSVRQSHSVQLLTESRLLHKILAWCKEHFIFIFKTILVIPGGFILVTTNLLVNIWTPYFICKKHVKLRNTELWDCSTVLLWKRRKTRLRNN